MKRIISTAIFIMIHLLTFRLCAQPDGDGQAKIRLPYPASEYITDFQIDTLRISIGHGDNWANTWTNKDEIFSFFTDGKGFGSYIHDPSSAPVVITGIPPDIEGKDTGVSIEHLTAYGSGKNGRKVCGLVMIRGILYAWVRNLNLPDSPKGTGSALIYSEDYGKTWKWAEWNWPDIGYPVWLNAGKDYGDAQDDYAYFIAPDGPGAYADYPDMIMGRVKVSEILDRNCYRFFRKTSENEITWDSYENRTAVFTDSSGCFRPNLVYNPGIRKYLLSICSPYGEWKWWSNKNANRIAHLGIFEGDNPWGPWKTVYYEKEWGKPENRFAPNIPSRWISEDGTSFYLLYSCIPNGPYQFNIQKCTIKQGDN